jgi:inhibitor of the pro-sigma K processing machinery
MKSGIDGNILIYAGVVLAVGIIITIFKGKQGKAMNFVIRFVLGGIFIYFFNTIGAYIKINIPLNPITALVTGMLELPGLALIIILKYIVYK